MSEIKCNTCEHYSTYLLITSGRPLRDQRPPPCRSCTRFVAKTDRYKHRRELALKFGGIDMKVDLKGDLQS